MKLYRGENMAKFCTNCGHELNEGADVCLNCGKNVSNKGININFSSDIPSDRRSKIVAALLAFFLGGLGIHNFYLGYTAKGVAQLLLTLIGWIVLIGPIISGVWALIEFVMILTGSITDANGNTLM